MQASEYIRGLEEQIAEMERLLERLRMKAKIAREVTADLEECDDSLAADTPPVVGAPAAVIRDTACQQPVPRAPGIGSYPSLCKRSRKTPRKDNPGPCRKARSQTKSNKPRNIVRNCLWQLIEKRESGN